MFLKIYDKVLEYVKNARGLVKKRPLLDKVIEALEANDSTVYLVSAPTGYGKTLISMSVSLHEFYQGFKTIVAYPLTSLIEEQVKIMKDLFRFHGLSGDLVGSRYMGSRESPYLIHPVTLTTIDTLSLTALGLSPEDVRKVLKNLYEYWFSNLGHYLFSWSSVYSSTFLVLDEFHLMYDSSKSLNFLRALVDLCESFGVKIILMSATLPKSFESLFSKLPKTGKIRFSKDEDPDFFGERASKKYRIELHYFNAKDKLIRILELLTRSEFRKALVVFNTVEDAINFYRLLSSKEDATVEKILIHSRFSAEDRESKISKLEELKKSGSKCVMVGTQSIEAGIDITSDLIISEIAPPISLIQRFGRFLRYDEKEGKAHIWVEDNELDSSAKYYKVYDKDLTKRTLDYLSSNSDVNLHISYDDLLNYVYYETPQINESLISEFRSILWELLEPSKSALKLLIKLEGSFVREGVNVTVTSEDGVDVNVSYDYLMSLKKRGLCRDCPKDEFDAVIRSLSGEKFRVYVKYDREVGLYG